MTIHQAILFGEHTLAAKGIDDPRWNGERLLLLSLGQSRSRTYAELDRELTTEEFSRFQELLQKRVQHYPLAYMEGTQQFFGRDFVVTEAVLIPRPETEEIIRAVLDLQLKKPRILDLGAGSGVIPITLSLEIPGCSAVALELSPSAIAVLRQNNKGNVRIVRANFSSLCFLPGTFDLITANLPYVESNEFPNLPAETKWEPGLALRTESLEETYRSAIQQSSYLLKPGGYLVLEIGYGQADRIKTVCDSVPEFNMLRIRKDQHNIDRVVLLQRERC